MRAAWFTPLAALLFCGLAGGVRAQTDEIQVYTGEINEPGQFSVTLHNNYTASGAKSPAFLGGMRPDHALNGSPSTPWGSPTGSSLAPTCRSTADY